MQDPLDLVFRPNSFQGLDLQTIQLVHLMLATSHTPDCINTLIVCWAQDVWAAHTTVDQFLIDRENRYLNMTLLGLDCLINEQCLFQYFSVSIIHVKDDD
jgi:hypothetical protein